MDIIKDIDVLLQAKHRLIVLETDQEQEYMDGFQRLENESKRHYFSWTVTNGLRRMAEGFSPIHKTDDIIELFYRILRTPRGSVFVLIDFHHYIKDPKAIRFLKDVQIQTPQHAIVLLSPKIKLPQELELSSTRHVRSIPTHVELTKMVRQLAADYQQFLLKKVKLKESGVVEKLVGKLSGLTFSDAKNLAKETIWNDGILCPDDIEEVAKKKFDLLNRNGVLRLKLRQESLDNIAGFHNLKKWLQVRKDIFSGKTKLVGGDVPSGMLLLGVQGCGKSLAAKAVAGSWQLPLLHLDFGSMYTRYYGETERNLRESLAVAEQMSPCVLWLDEIEKGMAASTGSDNVAKRLLGTFLTWLSEKKSSVFVVATANDVSDLPPELLRKGRFDEIFFVDLPDLDERKSILELHLQKREFEGSVDCTQIASNTEGFSGAELEQLVVSGLYETIATKSALDTDLLNTLVTQTKPLSVLMHEKVNELRIWAQGRTTVV
jgi:AAA+ superfamily predicted ATPase